MASSSGKKRVSAKKYSTRYDTAWELSYPVKRVKTDDHKFHCIPCNKDLSCGHQGIKDIKEHCEVGAHKKNFKTYRESHSLTTLFGNQNEGSGN